MLRNASLFLRCSRSGHFRSRAEVSTYPVRVDRTHTAALMLQPGPEPDRIHRAQYHRASPESPRPHQLKRSGGLEIRRSVAEGISPAGSARPPARSRTTDRVRHRLSTEHTHCNTHTHSGCSRPGETLKHAKHQTAQMPNKPSDRQNTGGCCQKGTPLRSRAVF